MRPLLHYKGPSGHKGPSGPWTRLCQNGYVQKYAVVIHENPEGGFGAEVPALPGCYSQGESVSELMDNACEPIAGVLDVIKDQGRQPESNIQTLDLAVGARSPVCRSARARSKWVEASAN
jgi:predicted RNase H-like HicB family nuclease